MHARNRGATLYMQVVKMKTKTKLFEHMDLYINRHGIQHFSGRTGVCVSVIEKILSSPESSFRFSTIERLYIFFDLERDEYFKIHLRRWNPPTKSIPGSIVRVKRIEKCLTISELSKLIRCSERTLKRLES